MDVHETEAVTSTKYISTFIPGISGESSKVTRFYSLKLDYSVREIFKALHFEYFLCLA